LRLFTFEDKFLEVSINLQIPVLAHAAEEQGLDERLNTVKVMHVLSRKIDCLPAGLGCYKQALIDVMNSKKYKRNNEKDTV
jgi:hypothetical protein